MTEKMKMYRIGTASELIGMPEKTLYGYIRSIEKETSHEFYRKNMIYSNTKVKQILLKEEEVTLLKELRRIRELKLLPLKLAVYKLFEPEKYKEYIDFESHIE